MEITSINLSALPFQGNCDTTRLQMASKQMAQAIVHNNCEIPHIVSSHYRQLSHNSSLGIYFALDDGNVVYNNNELIVLYYKNLNKVETHSVPPIKNSFQIFGSSLRYKINKTTFKKNDIIFSYSDFTNGIPSFGYNTFTAYMNFFGFTHEDSLVISESLAKKAKTQFNKTVYIPIYEYNLFKPLYMENKKPFNYFPYVGQQIKNGLIYSQIKPKAAENSYNSKDLKSRMMVLLKTMNLSDLLNISNNNTTKFTVDEVTTDIPNAYVTGIKIHKLKKNVNLVDSRFNDAIDKLYSIYVQNNIMNVYNDISNKLGIDYAKYIAKERLIFQKPMMNVKKQEIDNAVYIIELDISGEKNIDNGDKICNRFAAKGVVSLILPDELRPYTEKNKTPIDYIYSPFGVFSRMNISQSHELIISKCIKYYQDQILNNPDYTAYYLYQLNENIIKNLNSDEYYQNVYKHIMNIDKNPELRKNVVNDIVQNKLFIEAPAFTEMNFKNILQHADEIAPPMENIVIKKETLEYMKDKLKVSFTIPNHDIIVKNILCGPVYVFKLNKIANKIYNARDLGPIQGLTGQASRGRAKEGGCKLGQMEMEAIIAHGANKTLKEISTVKSDYNEAKENLISSLIKTGIYSLNDMKFQKKEGKTKKTTNTYLQFLKD